jgi:hypothetical protein
MLLIALLAPLAWPAASAPAGAADAPGGQAIASPAGG